MGTITWFAAGVGAVSALERGVWATLRLVADDKLEGVRGRCFDALREARSHPRADDVSAAPAA